MQDSITSLTGNQRSLADLPNVDTFYLSSLIILTNVTAEMGLNLITTTANVSILEASSINLKTQMLSLLISTIACFPWEEKITLFIDE